MMKDIEVAVFMVTYNHSKFIRESLDGILKQNTRFNFKIFIGEDCSTDNTREILIEYKNRFAEKIELILHPKNIGPSRNVMSIYKKCFESGAKYIAMCEGDDYWTDSHKLQKQVDILNKDLQYNICFHNAKVWRSGIVTDELVYGIKSPSQLSFNDLLKGMYTKACCSLIRIVEGLDLKVYEMPLEQIQDTTFFLAALEDEAKAYYINEVMAVYRKHEGGVWGLLDDENRLKSSYHIYIFLKEKYVLQEHQDIIDRTLKYTTLSICFVNIKFRKWRKVYHWYIKYRHTKGHIRIKHIYLLARKYFLNKEVFKISMKK